MHRWLLTGMVCITALVAWLAFAPSRGRTHERRVDGEPGSIAVRSAGSAAAADAAVDARILIGPKPPVPVDPAFELQRVTCVDDETVLAPDPHRTDRDKPTTRVDPTNVRVVRASRVSMRRGPRLSAEYQARLQLELRDRQIFVMHETSSGESFFVEVPDKTPAQSETEPSLYEVYRLRTGHTLAISFEADGSLESVAYGEPNKEVVEIPAANEAQVLALFNLPLETVPTFVAIREEQLAYQPRIVCNVSERLRVKRSGEFETARMTVECIAGPSSSPSEFFILPLTP